MVVWYCIVLIASMKLSVDCSLCRDLSVKGLRMLVKCFESCLVGQPQNETFFLFRGGCARL